MTRKALTIAIVSVLVSGCVVQKTALFNDKGQVFHCNANGWGWLGAPVAMIEHSECVKKAKAAGYSETPPSDPLAPLLKCAQAKERGETDPSCP
jgi:hypothetical protein